MASEDEGHERTGHEERAMREIDDPEQPEDDRKAEAQHRIERPVDQTEDDLSGKADERNAKNLNHGSHRQSGDRAHNARTAIGATSSVFSSSHREPVLFWSSCFY